MSGHVLGIWLSPSRSAAFLRCSSASYMLGLSMVKFQFDLFQNIFLNAICQDLGIGLGFGHGL